MCFSLFIMFSPVKYKLYKGRNFSLFAPHWILSVSVCWQSQHSENVCWTKSLILSLWPLLLSFVHPLSCHQSDFQKPKSAFHLSGTLSPHNEVPSVSGGTAPAELPAKSQHPPQSHHSPRWSRSAATWETPVGPSPNFSPKEWWTKWNGSCKFLVWGIFAHNRPLKYYQNWLLPVLTDVCQSLPIIYFKPPLS